MKGVPQSVELLFDLVIENGWPPVAVEGLPATQVAEGYRMEVPPLFVKEISTGDVISVTTTEAGHVDSWTHVKKSGRTTIWLLRIATTDQIDDVLTELRALNCNTSQLPEFGCYSIDVPGEISISKIDACLARLDPSKVAVAYPSFRHVEP